MTLRFPSNVDGLPFHHWSSAMAMATPIAHKGATAGAKVIAATMFDLLQDEELRDRAWHYFREEQLKGDKYVPFISKDDPPAIEKNAETMGAYRERMREFYYDPARYETYLEQLGIDYPQLEPAGCALSGLMRSKPQYACPRSSRPTRLRRHVALREDGPQMVFDRANADARLSATCWFDRPFATASATSARASSAARVGTAHGGRAHNALVRSSSRLQIASYDASTRALDAPKCGKRPAR